jgi:hypothetical protein
LVKRLILVFLVIIITITISYPVLASPTLSVSQAKVDITVSQGEYIHTMVVSISKDNPPTDISIEINGLAQQLDGVIQSISTPKDISPYSGSQLINLNTETSHLEPGESKEVTARIKIPADIGDGGRYAIIRIYTSPQGNGKMNAVSAIAVPVFITIKDSNLTHTAKISNVATSSISSGKPVEILTTFQNTGNHHFKVKGEVTITDSTGKILDTLYESLTPSSIIPTMSRQLKTTFIPQGELPLGTYSLKSKIMLEDGTILDEATGSFEVKAPYVPPPPPASVNLKPSSAATLQTDDGRIIINFPQGAVLGEAKVSLQSYPPEQLPPPPTGLTAATTCFRVDGLNGLLTKEAKMTVKYSSADLQKAGGDASKLRLARWDEVSNQWTVLKTSVDKPTMTLIASTNQFSLWAVMVGTPPSPATGSPASPANWTLFAVIGGAVFVVTVVILLFIRKRKG